MVLTFTVPETEASRIEAWKNEHTRKAHGGNTYAGAIGGRYSVIFTPTGLGNIISVSCSMCKVSKDVTDYEEFG